MSLKGKLEYALQKVLSQSDELPVELRETANAKSRIFMGADSEGLTRPCVVVWVQGGEEEPQGSGNCWQQVSVLVKSPGDADSTGDLIDFDPVANHNARAEAVLGILCVDNLGELLSAAGESLTVYDPITDVNLQPDLEGRSFVDGMTFRCYCAPTAIL